MKRFSIRVVAVLFALALGWQAGGQWQAHERQLFAAPSAHAAGEEHGHHGQGHGPDPARLAADRRVPHPRDVSWYPWVWTGVGLLFALAVVIGLPVQMFKGPEPPDPAADHH